jgi:hypothetical protein
MELPLDLCLLPRRSTCPDLQISFLILLRSLGEAVGRKKLCKLFGPHRQIDKEQRVLTIHAARSAWQPGNG